MNLIEKTTELLQNEDFDFDNHTPYLNSSHGHSIKTESEQRSDIVLVPGQYYLSVRADNLEQKGFKAELNNNAFYQLMNRSKVPGSFFKRCPDRIKSLIRDHFCMNHNLLARLRYKYLNNDSNLMVRGLVTPSWPVNTDDVFVEQLIKNWKESQDSIGSFQSVMFDDLVTLWLIPIHKTKVEGVGISSFIRVRNSEVGVSALVIEPVIKITGASYCFRMTNTKSDRIIHRGNVVDNRVPLGLDTALTMAQAGEHQVIEMLLDPESILNNHETILKKLEINGLPTRLAAWVNEQVSEEETAKRDALFNRASALLQSMPIIKSISIENMLGKSIDLFSDYESRIQRLKAVV